MNPRLPPGRRGHAVLIAAAAAAVVAVVAVSAALAGSGGPPRDGGGPATGSIPAAGGGPATGTMTRAVSVVTGPADTVELQATQGQLTIVGSGASSTIIDATHTDRAFAVHTGASLAISRVTVQNGSQPNAVPSSNSVGAGDGGAFYNDGSLSVDSSALTNNSATDGGVVFSDVDASATSITNSTVTGNTTSAYGGAVYAISGSVTFTGDSVTHN
ncbi:MAG: hypothetical protein ABSA03_18115, partial [Streptosporangiaceae bacterium]